MPESAKRFDYGVEVARDGRLTADGEAPLEPGAPWSPDHLLIAALARCVIKSLRYHGDRTGVATTAAADASGTVSKRESDGRYAFVEIACSLDVELDPEPGADDLKALLLKAERDCFVGSSLTVKPSYRWRVNGRDVPLVDPVEAAEQAAGAA